MINDSRRRFLNYGVALVGTNGLSACGGGGEGAAVPEAGSLAVEAGESPSVQASAAQQAVTKVAAKYVPLVQTSTGMTQLTLRGGITGIRPFDCGMVFRQGDWPAGQSAESMQINVLTTWPDGSAKTAIVCGYTYCSSGKDAVVGIRAGLGASGAAIATGALQTAGVTAVIDCGALGKASWATTDWGQPFLTVCQGPVMSSWVYRKKVGTDAHLVAWLEIRCFNNGEIKVIPWIENGYINIAAPTNKAATYQFTLAGKARLGAGLAIDLKHHQRTPLVTGQTMWHWVGTDPGVVPLHDASYLMSTELVPSYYTKLSAGHALVKALPTGYTPLAQGVFTYSSDSMASSGFQQPIGLLPQHDVLHLVADAADRVTTFRAVVQGGYTAGRYGIHYRDENTNRPLRFSDHATRNINSSAGFKDTGGSTTGSYTPKPAGGNPPTWDVAHSPSVGYFAHLLTGHWYFLEECQFAATANYLGNGDNIWLRVGSSGLVQTATGAWQTRASAWDWRSHVQALAITPDADPVPGGVGNSLRQEFVNRAHANIDHFHGRYVAQPNNPFGLILPGETYDGSMSRIAVWQQDFVTAAWGYGKCLGLPVDATRRARMDAFFAWKARSVVGRMGTAADFPLENANRYVLELSASLSHASFAAGAGPWPSSWSAVYASTALLADKVANPLVNPGGNLLAQEYDSIAAAKGMWGNLQMAIAYAVRHAAPGASSAYARMIGASNWSSMLLNQWATSAPVLAVRPSQDPGAVPAWLKGVGVNSVVAIAGSNAGIPPAVLTAWGCMVLVDGTGTFFSSANGGHKDSSDNGVYSIDLTADAPRWTTRIAPSGAVQINVTHYQDGKPSSRHGYQYAHYIPQRNRVMLFGAHGLYGDAWTGTRLDAHTVGSAPLWDKAGSWPNLPEGAYGIARDPRNGNVWVSKGTLWVQSTNSLKTVSTYSGALRWGWQWDEARLRFAGFQWADGQGYGAKAFLAQIMNPDTGAATNITWSSDGETAGSLAEIAANQPGSGAVPAYEASCYDPGNDCFWLYFGNISSQSGAQVFYRITPQSGATGWRMQRVRFGGAQLPLTPSAGIAGRLRYVPRLGGIAIVPHGNAGFYFIRTR
jgi:hypothetical protein